MSDVHSLRRDAEAIWRAGVEAVDAERLVRDAVRRDGPILTVCGRELDLRRVGRMAVVGAGKGGAGMAAGFEQAVGADAVEKVSGWINVPADCVRSLQVVHLHAARPAGVNEPTAEGVQGTTKILDIVSGLGPDDVCIVLLSGGGSALLPAPAPGITLADKQAVTRLLMQSGATIGELNCVRKQLSRIKGGRLATACRAGVLVALIISDVIGDPLETIASGPTVPDEATPAEALAVLRRYAQSPDDVPQSVWQLLEQAADRSGPPPAPTVEVHNAIIGNNRVALDAAAAKAQELGYAVHSLGSDNAGEAPEVGKKLAELCLSVRRSGEPLPPPACLLSGGEPVVRLARTDQPRKGGRNQEVALAALVRLWDEGLDGIAVLSGGTDGEDGPTDAAGAVADARVLAAARAQGLDPAEFLAINNSYPFFEQTGGLLKTGPTHTNVMDLRVALVAPGQECRSVKRASGYGVTGLL